MLDAALLSIILFPLIYLLVYRPSILQIRELDEKESRLKELNESLEAKVGARTREMEELNAEMKAILDYSSDAILRIDGSGLIQSANRRAVEMLRCRISALMGMAISDIFPIDAQRLMVDGFVASLGSWSDTFVESRLEMEAKRGDGTLFPVELGVSGCVIKGDTSSIMVVRDITERKHAESVIRERQMRLQAVIDNSAAAIFLKDRDGTYIMANNRFAEIAGKSKEQVIGKKDWELFPEYHARLF
ncbi:MAG: PAS domain S-box protein [Nitrospinae bacterium]|nr:PAS domain S-box protein [Nitrospinota bacterium]